MKSFLHKLNGAEFKVCRLQEAPTAQDKAALDEPDKIAAYVRPMLANSIMYRPDVENLIVIFLSTRMKPIGFEIVSTGTLDTLLCHPREVFRSAIIAGAASIVILHNHPSGDPSPSEADIKVTRDLIRAGQLLKIELKDHIILGNPTHCSIRSLGYFYN